MKGCSEGTKMIGCMIYTEVQSETQVIENIKSYSKPEVAERLNMIKISTGGEVKRDGYQDIDFF